LKSKGKLVSDSKEKDDILIQQFKSVFTIDKSTAIPQTTKHIDEPIPKLTIRENGVEKLLQDINPSKASGPDGIPNRILKECASQIALSLTVIFQKSIDTGRLPEDWLSASISCVYKKGDKHASENYRPVSLTSVPGKLLEHIMKHLERHRILTSLNHGFRSGYSCEAQLLGTLHDFMKAYDAGLQTDVAILDFSKAFDTVQHKKLLSKMDSYGIRGPINNWLNMFLTHRKMKVVVEGEQSEEVTVDSGVPQGTVLGLLLFLCHINDLPDVVKSSVRLFAADCLLYRIIKSAKDHQLLQEDLKSLQAWANDLGMRFNAKICYILSIKNKSQHFCSLNGHILQQVQNNPYLGLQISEDLKWTIHIANVAKKANPTLGFLRRNLKYCPQECKKTAYISLVRSTIEYGGIIWDPYTETNINRLERIQRQAARFITGDYRSREKGVSPTCL
jgi:hypothetical protein